MTGPSLTVADPARDTEWANRGRCRDAEDPDLWFPVSYERDRAQVAEAKAECARCPVIDACLAWALEKKPAGIWGGLTDDERDELIARNKRDARRKPKDPPGGHGSTSGYYTHRRYDDPPCAECKAAVAAAARQRYKSRRTA